MSFEIEYENDGVTVKEFKNVTPVEEEQPETEVEETETEEVEDVDNADTESEEDDDNADIEEVIPVQTKKAVKDSWSELREKAQRAERRAKELEDELLNERSNKKKESKEEYKYHLDEDELVEGKHLSAVEKKIQLMEDKLKKYEQQSSMSATESRLKAQYADFDAIVSRENLEKLSENYPEIAQTLYSNDDLFAKGKTAYIMIKKLGIAKNDTNINHDRMQAIKNSAKPKSLASIKPQQGNSPLSKAHQYSMEGEMGSDMQEALIK